MAMDELVKLMEDVSKIACSFLPIEHLTDTVRIFVCQRTIFQAYLVGLSGALTNLLAQTLSRDFGFYGFAAEQNSFT